MTRGYIYPQVQSRKKGSKTNCKEEKKMGIKDFLKRFNNIVNLEFGVSKTSGLLQHELHLLVGISPDKYGFYGAKIKFMLSDTFGIDVRLAKSFGLETAKYLQPWREEAYIVFSPVLRINY